MRELPDPYEYSNEPGEGGSTKLPCRRGVPFPAVALLFVAVAVAAFLNSPYFQVTRIEVDGATYLSDAEVRFIAGVPEGSNVFTIPLAEIDKRLEATPRIARARVYRLVPDAVRIEVEERATSVYLPYAGYFIDLDPEGTAIAVTEAITDPNIPLLVGVAPTYVSVGEHVQPHARVELGASIGAALAARRIPMLSEIDVSNESCVVLRTSDGIRVLLGDAQSIEARVDLLDSILASVREQSARVDYIDVRVEARPVIGR